MKFKFGIYSLFVLLLIFESCGSSKQVTYFQTKENRKGEIVELPSYRRESIVRFKPDDVLGITVNFPGESSIAADYNLPLVPVASQEDNLDGVVNQGIGRQTFLVKKDGTIDFPVVGNVKVAGYTQGELEDVLIDSVMRISLDRPIVTVRLANFSIYVTGEVSSPGKISVSKDNINILEALALAGDMTIYGKRDDVLLIRQKPDGGYTRISLDISKEEIISSPYYFLQQNDELYIKPNSAKVRAAEFGPNFSLITGVSSFIMAVVPFVFWIINK